MTDLSTVEVGAELPTISQQSSLMTSVLYAGASGDMNPLHYDESIAAQISPSGGIIAHGMYSMGLVSRALTEWAGGPERVAEVSVRFTKPWPLGTTTTFGGTVSEITQDEITVDLWATNESGDPVLKGTGRVRR
jgi:acyl dehydratase